MFTYFSEQPSVDTRPSIVVFSLSRLQVSKTTESDGWPRSVLLLFVLFTLVSVFFG